jgi:hypothetical protein
VRREILRNTLKTEAAFVLARHLCSVDANSVSVLRVPDGAARAQRLLLEVLREKNSQHELTAQVNLAMVLCRSEVAEAACQWQEFWSFAHRTQPAMLSLNTPLFAGGARGEVGASSTRVPTLLTAEQLLTESIATLQGMEHLYSGQHAVEAVVSHSEAPWVVPKQELLPPHLLSHALLLLGHLQRHTRGMEAARTCFLSSAQQHRLELERRRLRHLHTRTHSLTLGHHHNQKHSSVLENDAELAESGGSAVGWGEVWLWTPLTNLPDRESQKTQTNDGEQAALLQAGATLV